MNRMLEEKYYELSLTEEKKFFFTVEELQANGILETSAVTGWVLHTNTFAGVDFSTWLTWKHPDVTFWWEPGMFNLYNHTGGWENSRRFISLQNENWKEVRTPGEMSLVTADPFSKEDPAFYFAITDTCSSSKTHIIALDYTSLLTSGKPTLHHGRVLYLSHLAFSAWGGKPCANHFCSLGAAMDTPKCLPPVHKEWALPRELHDLRRDNLSTDSEPCVIEHCVNNEAALLDEGLSVCMFTAIHDAPLWAHTWMVSTIYCQTGLPRDFVW